MRALNLIAVACRLHRPGLVLTPSVRSFALALVFVLVWTATRSAVTVTGSLARSLTVAGLGVLVAAANASALLRDLDVALRGALRYYGFGSADFLMLYAFASLPLTALEAACGMLALEFPGWSDARRFGLLLAAWTAATALVTAAAERLRGVDIVGELPVPRAGAGRGTDTTDMENVGVRRTSAVRGAPMASNARLRCRLPLGARLRRRLPALGFAYLRSASRWPVLAAAAEGVLIAYVLGRLDQPLSAGVYVAGAYLAATVICVLSEVDDTAAARFARSRYGVADAELRRVKLALTLPLLLAECLMTILSGVWAGARIDGAAVVACLVYLPLLAAVLADAATAYTRRHRMLPAAELGGALLALVPGLPLAVLPAAAHLLRRRTRARSH
ncbi:MULTISPECIES: hypothetical protein [unclassified Actinomyces]|uniref:hypothetical protein n=1 Tax=unclassified Actinomyces TaxID=2609248 RepID=UPI00131ED751|nr:MULTISPECIES: hypothetical protein [unclassified Actinomyces]